jgi:predicted small metal-binding protein
MPAVRVIRCDCGFEASGDADDDLVGRAQDHARDVHGMDLSADVVLGLAKAKAQPPDS